jgi:hypothetical protein
MGGGREGGRDEGSVLVLDRLAVGAGHCPLVTGMPAAGLVSGVSWVLV